MTTLIELEEKLLNQDWESSTFKQCSFDDQHNVFVCENETIEVFDLDEIKEIMLKERYLVPASIDAIWIDHRNHTLHLVEFKNISKMSKNKKKEIRLKVLDSLLFLDVEFGVRSAEEFSIVFVLVRTLGMGERSSYHVKSRAKEYTPAYLKYIKELAGIKVFELMPEDFNQYLENSEAFLKS
ncbi:hypothetical protein [Sporosarcina sp. FA9]|uniref:hypothetical protein n=1 Tax=Sporosarcina sp. FA9 TaxID=3413030 RepID=UPI003F65C7BF